MNNLPEIKDIHIPDDVSIFPLAYGWWVILSAIVFVFLMIKFFLFILKTSKKIYALNQLKQIETDNPVLSAMKMSRLLRRICNVKYKAASTLYGKEWVSFLENNSPEKLSKESAELLIFAPFIDKNNHNYTMEQAVELKDFCKHFIGANL